MCVCVCGSAGLKEKHLTLLFLLPHSLSFQVLTVKTKPFTAAVQFFSCFATLHLPNSLSISVVREEEKFPLHPLCLAFCSERCHNDCFFTDIMLWGGLSLPRTGQTPFNQVPPLLSSLFSLNSFHSISPSPHHLNYLTFPHVSFPVPL